MFHGTSYAVGGNINWCSHSREQCGGSLKTKNKAILWSSNPTPRHISEENATCTPMFRAALFTIAKTWKQPKCPSADEWMKKTWCIYATEYYSALKKNEIMPFAATWMDLEMIPLSEARERQIPDDIMYRWNLTQMNLGNRNRLTDIENKLIITKRERGWGKDKLSILD